MTPSTKAPEAGTGRHERDLSHYRMAPDGFTLVRRAESIKPLLEQHRIIEKPSYVPFGRELAAMKAAAKKSLPIMLLGRPAVGKTTSVERIAHSLEVPMITELGKEETQTYDYVGYRQEAGDMIFYEDGKFSLCARSETGVVLYFDEAIRTPKGVFTSLAEAFDYRRQLSLVTLEVLDTKKVVVVFSFNPPKLEDVELLPHEATIDRFVVLRYPKKDGKRVREIFERKYRKNGNGNGEELGEEMAEEEAIGKYGTALEKIYDELNGKVLRNEYAALLQGEATERSFRKAIKLISAGLDLETAVQVSYVNGMVPVEHPQVEDFIKAAGRLVGKEIGVGE